MPDRSPLTIMTFLRQYGIPIFGVHEPLAPLSAGQHEVAETELGHMMCLGHQSLDLAPNRRCFPLDGSHGSRLSVAEFFGKLTQSGLRGRTDCQPIQYRKQRRQAIPAIGRGAQQAAPFAATTGAASGMEGLQRGQPKLDAVICGDGVAGRLVGDRGFDPHPVTGLLPCQNKMPHRPFDPLGNHLAAM